MIILVEPEIMNGEEWLERGLRGGLEGCSDIESTFEVLQGLQLPFSAGGRCRLEEERCKVQSRLP